MTPEEMEGHAQDLRRLLEGLRDGKVDLAAAREFPRINRDLGTVLTG
jgi:hypothetical protein